MSEAMKSAMLRICTCCGFKMTEAEAEKNEQIGLCFDCIIHGQDGRFDLMDREDTWQEWDRGNRPDDHKEQGHPEKRQGQ